MNIDLNNTIHLWAVMIGSGVIGMVAHAIRKWEAKETDSPWAWLVRDNARASVGSLITLIGAVAAAAAGDVFHGMTVLQIAIACAPYGYANDSVVNKGAPAAQ